MPLNLTSKVLGDVFVLDCEGEIVLGEETRALLSRLETDSREFCHIVLTVDRLTRLDSSGVGLIVRSMRRLRRRGGDLRIAAPQPWLNDLLTVTRLTSVLRVFPSELEAAASFAAETAEAASGNLANRVVLIDRSADFGVFIRAVLSQHGVEVRVAGSVDEARVLLRCQTAGFILLGPGSWQESARASLGKWAPRAMIVELGPEMRSSDAGHAAETLLEILQASPAIE